METFAAAERVADKGLIPIFSVLWLLPIAPWRSFSRLNGDLKNRRRLSYWQLHGIGIFIKFWHYEGRWRHIKKVSTALMSIDTVHFRGIATQIVEGIIYGLLAVKCAKSWRRVWAWCAVTWLLLNQGGSRSSVRSHLPFLDLDLNLCVLTTENWVSLMVKDIWVSRLLLYSESI